MNRSTTFPAVSILFSLVSLNGLCGARSDGAESGLLFNSLGFNGPIRCLAFAPDSQVIAAGGNRGIHLVSVKSGDRLHVLKGHADEVSAVAFSPNGSVLASGSRDATIRLWETNSGKLIKVLQGGVDGKNHVHLKDLPISSLAFSGDGKRLLSCGTNNYVTFWDVTSGLWDLKAWTNHADRGKGCSYLTVSRDGRYCAIAAGVCAERHTRQVSLFQVDHGLKPIWNNGHAGDLAATHVAFADDGSRLLSCGHDNAVRVWDVTTNRLLRTLPGPEGNKTIQAALFTPNGRYVVGTTRSGMLMYWSYDDGELLASTRAGNKNVAGLALATDGTTAATCTEDGSIDLWHLGAFDAGKKTDGK